MHVCPTIPDGRRENLAGGCFSPQLRQPVPSRAHPHGTGGVGQRIRGGGTRLELPARRSARARKYPPHHVEAGASDGGAAGAATEWSSLARSRSASLRRRCSTPAVSAQLSKFL